MSYDHFKTMDDYEYYGWSADYEELIPCEFCMNEMPKEDLFDTVDYEGAKAVSCEECANHPDVVEKTPFHTSIES